MIELFAIENYKSIKDLLIVDFSNERYKINNEQMNLFIEYENKAISRINFFYGKNGSGKSSIVDALKVFRDITLFNNEISDISPRTRRAVGFEKVVPFKLVDKIKNDTFFSITFVINNMRYRYSISYDTTKNVINEEILEYFNKEFKIVFSKNKNEFKGLSAIEKERLETYKLDKMTIIGVINNEIQVSDKEYLAHFKNTLMFFNAMAFDFFDLNNNKSLKTLFDDKHKLTKITEQVKKYDLSIDDIKVSAREVSLAEFKKRYKILFADKKNKYLEDLVESTYQDSQIEYELNIIHKKKKLDYSEESTGTQRILNFLFSLYATSKKIWIIDDFEHDLHTEAAISIVDFLSKNLHKSQFIFITHELDFLNQPAVHNKALHYFVERDEEELSTQVIKLSQFSDLRNDERNNWEQFYRKFRLAQYPRITIME